VLSVADEKDDKASEGGFRRMLEETVITPFFRHHSSHMPATLKLLGEVSDEGDYVVLKASVPGLDLDQIDVSATVNTFDLSLSFRRTDSHEDKEIAHEDDRTLTSSYVTPCPIDPDRLEVSFTDDSLEARAPKIRVE